MYRYFRERFVTAVVFHIIFVRPNRRCSCCVNVGFHERRPSLYGRRPRTRKVYPCAELMYNLFSFRTKKKKKTFSQKSRATGVRVPTRVVFNDDANPSFSIAVILRVPINVCVVGKRSAH